MTIGEEPRFEACEGWGVLPDGWRFVEVAGVATDSRDRVFVFNRGDHPVIVFDREGRFVGSWGEGLFVRPHGITIGPDDAVYCTDDFDHTVRKFTPEGTAADAGHERTTVGHRGHQPWTTGRSAGPARRSITRPTWHWPRTVRCTSPMAMATLGSTNSRPTAGSSSRGASPGGPGQFQLPHGIAVGPDGTVVVADRENSRLQLFSPDGKFLEEWTDVARPCQVFVDAGGHVYVAELGFRAGMWPGTTAPARTRPGAG